MAYTKMELKINYMYVCRGMQILYYFVFCINFVICNHVYINLKSQISTRQLHKLRQDYSVRMVLL